MILNLENRNKAERIWIQDRSSTHLAPWKEMPRDIEGVDVIVFANCINWIPVINLSSFQTYLSAGSGSVFTWGVELVKDEPIQHSEDRTATASLQLPEEQDYDGWLQRLFESAQDEEFEDGFETHFTNRLRTFIEITGIDGVLALSSIITNINANREIASEALKLVGRMIDPETHEIRRWLLEKALCNRSARARDGAALGIESLNDPKSITALKNAIESEICDELRSDMELVLNQFSNQK